MKGNIMNKEIQNKKGFTLIELLVVISIIALLLSILMPSLQKAKEMARTVVCKNQQRNLYTMMHLYAQDHNGMLPNNRISGDNDKNEYWTWLLRDYYNVKKSRASISNEEAMQSYLKCPSSVPLRETWVYWYSDYAVNGCKGAFKYDDQGRTNKIFSIRPADKVVMFLESAALLPDGSPARYRSLTWRSLEQSYIDTYGLFFATRHSGEQNIMFFDGSTKKVTIEYLQEFDSESKFWNDK
jgi:prepilin-type N-terminal cleavage/methylation domain-containing protein